MYYDELECTPSFLSLTHFSPCGASTPLPTLLGKGGRRRGMEPNTTKRAVWFSFYLSIKGTVTKVVFASVG
jgi:hypothetical protein